MDYDRIATSAPVNKQAALSTAKGGDSWKPMREYHEPRSETPFPMKSPAFSERDLTGMKLGRLTVIGKFANTKKSHKGRWVVQCVCGIYTIRRGEVLTDSRNSSCEECRYVEWLAAGCPGRGA